MPRPTNDNLDGKLDERTFNLLNNAMIIVGACFILWQMVGCSASYLYTPALVQAMEKCGPVPAVTYTTQEGLKDIRTTYEPTPDQYKQRVEAVRACQESVIKAYQPTLTAPQRSSVLNKFLRGQTGG